LESESVIIDPQQRAVKYTVAGVSESFNVGETREEDYYSQMLFEGD
jgi:hypothetical protein